MVEISKKRLKELERMESKLNALEAGGVDNWEFYGEALSEWFKENQIEEMQEDFIENLYEVLIEATVDYPAGREAGHCITLEEADENFIKKLLLDFAKEYQNL